MRKFAKVMHILLEALLLVGCLYLIGFTLNLNFGSNPGGLYLVYSWGMVLPGLISLFIMWRFYDWAKPMIIESYRMWRYRPPKTPTAVLRRKKKRRHAEPEETYEPETHGKGELFRRLGIDYRKLEKRPETGSEIKPSGNTKDISKDILYARWESLIDRLEEGKRVYIGRHDHYGQLRGRDALRHIYRDLRRLGYNVELKMGDYDGYIYLKSEE